MFYYKTRNSEIIKLNIADGVYEPREDSLLLAKTLEEKIESMKAKGEAAESVLEIGCGSGLLSIAAAKAGCSVLAADIDENAVKCAKRNAVLNNVEIRAVQSNLFGAIKATEKFGFIVFNPPYLKEEQNEENRIWAGGNNSEIITKFIKEAGRFLKPGGEILIVISSLSGMENIMKEFSENNFEAKILGEQKIPWERLFAICAKIK